jgi:hypothetical protein
VFADYLAAFFGVFVWVSGFFAARGNYARRHVLEGRPGTYREGWLLLVWPFLIMADVIREERGY